MPEADIADVLNMENDSDNLAKFCEGILKHVENTAERGNLTSVFSSIEDYCSSNPKYALNIGKEKAKILDSLILERQPKTVLELGTFFGYGALTLARLLKPGAMVYSVEISSTFADIAKKIVEYSGMAQKIKVIVGKSHEVLTDFSSHTAISTFDFVLIDHWKTQYKPDLILLEQLGLIKHGSVIVADNVKFPGAPGYLEYVRGNAKYHCTNIPSKLTYFDNEDALEKSVYLG